VKHPTTGEMVVSNDEIKRVTLEYCVKNLKSVAKCWKTFQEILRTNIEKKGKS
jgi:hypothetical protein